MDAIVTNQVSCIGIGNQKLFGWLKKFILPRNLYVIYDSPDGHNVPVDVRKAAVSSHVYVYVIRRNGE